MTLSIAILLGTAVIMLGLGIWSAVAAFRMPDDGRLLLALIAVFLVSVAVGCIGEAVYRADRSVTAPGKTK